MTAQVGSARDRRVLLYLSVTYLRVMRKSSTAPALSASDAALLHLGMVLSLRTNNKPRAYKVEGRRGRG